MAENQDEIEDIELAPEVYELTEEEKEILYDKVEIGEDENWRSFALRASELVEREFQPPKPVISNLIPEGSLTILAGAPKAGKSWLVLDMAVSVATGRNLINPEIFEVSEPGEVLYLALEDTPRRIKDRMELMIDGKPNLDNLFVVNASPRMDDGGLKRIIGWLQDEEIKNPKLIIIDTLFHFRPGKTLGGGYANDALALVTLHKLAQRSNAAIIVITHDIKSKASPWFNSILGSKGLTGIADTLMLLRRAEGKRTANLYYMGRDIEEDKLHLKFEGSSARWIQEVGATDDDDEDEFKMLPKAQLDIMTYVLSNIDGEPWSMTDFMAGTGKTRDSIKTALSALKAKGFMKSAGVGKYCLHETFRNRPQQSEG